MTGRLIPALRWADEHGSRDGCCIGCGRGALLPHTSDCPELADIIRRAKEDNAMPAEFDEKTPLGRAIAVINKHHHAIEGGGTMESSFDARSLRYEAVVPMMARRYSNGGCVGCERHEGEHHHDNCPEAVRLKALDAGSITQQGSQRDHWVFHGIDLARPDSDQSVTVEYVSTRDMVAKAPSPLYVTEYGICHACGADITGTPHKCPVNWGPVATDERIRLDEFYFSRANAVRRNSDAQAVKSLVDAASLHDAGVRAQQQQAYGEAYLRLRDTMLETTKARQVMGILGPGTAELVATKTKLEAVTAERDELGRKNEDYSTRLFAANGKIRELEADLEAESALTDALLKEVEIHRAAALKRYGAFAAPAQEMQYEDLFGAQSMAAATAGPQKSAAMGRAIGATITGWRPVV